MLGSETITIVEIVPTAEPQGAAQPEQVCRDEARDHVAERLEDKRREPVVRDDA